MSRLLRTIAFGVVSAALVWADSGNNATVLSLSIDGVIHPVTVDMLERALAQAQREQHRLLLIRLNTPGGFLEATRAATEKILRSPVPVVTWVGPVGARAASAGFYLLQAGDVAAMAPGTSTGAAHPVLLVGTPDPTLTRKIENDTAASIRSVVARRGRNTQMSDKAILESRSFTDKEALSEHLIELVATSEADLLAQLNGRDISRFDGKHVRLDLSSPRIVEYQPTLSQRVQRTTSDPSISLGLLIIGALLVYIELTTPGAVLPGVAGAILCLVGLGALSILPVTWLGMSLLALALVLLALEVKITSHGVLGAGAVVCMVLGATLLVDSPIPELRIPVVSALGLALPFALIVTVLTGLVVRARIARVQSGAESFAGQPATVIADIRRGADGEGKVAFGAEIWDAAAAVDITSGTEVRVLAREGLTLTVEPVSPAAAKSASAAAGG